MQAVPSAVASKPARHDLQDESRRRACTHMTTQRPASQPTLLTWGIRSQAWPVPLATQPPQEASSVCGSGPSDEPISCSAPMHSMPDPGVADIGQPTSTPGLGWSATARTPAPHQTLRMSGGASRRWRRAARAWHVAYACRSQRAISRLRRTTRDVPPSRAGWTPVVVVVAPHNELMTVSLDHAMSPNLGAHA